MKDNQSAKIVIGTFKGKQVSVDTYNSCQPAYAGDRIIRKR